MATPDSQKQLQYSDLIQLVLFPDGSPLSSRLKNAAVLQQVLGEQNATHEKAVAFASRVNAYVPWWLRRQLGALQGGKSTWLPVFSGQNGNSSTAGTVWQSRATKQLELLLFEGLEKLVGFKGEVRIKQPGFFPQGKQKSLQGGDYIVDVFVEDASGVDQGSLEGSGMMAVEDADSPVFEVTSEDCMLRIQVKHTFPGLRYTETELLGELKVSLASLPSNAGFIELQLPVFAPYHLSPSIPVYKVHKNEVLNSENHTQTGFLQCSIAYSTDASRADPEQMPSEVANLTASSPGQAMFSLVQSLARQAEVARGRKRGLVVVQKMQGWFERHKAQGPRRAAIREKWIEITNKALLQEAMLLMRSKANMEVLQAMERSPVFGGGKVEEIFLELVDQVWTAWSRYGAFGTNRLPGTSVSTRSLDSLPTMINPSLGTLDFDKQPLYRILQEYDRYLAGVVADPKLSNVYIPGMPFFHLLFVFAMMRGISPCLMKLAMASHILKRERFYVHVPKGQHKVEYRLLRLLMSVIKQAHTEKKQQLLTATEEGLCLAVAAEMKAAAKSLLKNHYELIPSDDALARKFLLQEGKKHIAVMGSEYIVSTLTDIAKERMRAQLQDCDFHTIEQTLSRFRNVEDVRGCLKRLGKAWADAAGDFEATLGLKLEAKEQLHNWRVEDLLINHYKHLCESACSLIHKSPFWPYDVSLGYDIQDLQQFQDGVERMYDVMINFGLAKPPKKARAALLVDASQNGTATFPRESQLPGFVPPTFKYMVKIFTGTLPGADTDSQVFLNILGDVKSSGKCALTKEKLANKGSNKKLFEWGGEDEFMVPVQGNLGNLNEIELSTDGLGRGPSWYVDRVEITDMAANKVWYFNCQAWLSKSRGNCKLEQVFDGNPEHPSKRKAEYTVEVKTADVPAKGTITKVHICMYGSSGENHQQWLTAKMKNDFAQGQQRTFSIQCLDLDIIQKIRLGIQPHTLTPSQSRQSGLVKETPITNSKVAQKQVTEEWPVDYVIITNTKNNATWLFQVGDKFTNVQPNWLIHPIDEEDLAEYRVAVTTADNPKASLSRGKVHLQLVGAQGKSGLMVLDDPNRDKGFPPFQRGRTDRFSFFWKGLGQLKSLQISHDGVSVRGSLGMSNMTEWHVNKVVVLDVDHKQEYTFPCDFTLPGGNAAKTVQNPTVKPIQVRNLVTYQVTTHTSNIRKAGTDARVYLQIFGENNLSSERQQLVNKSKLNLFEMGQVDDFIIKCPDLGSLQKIVIEHDNTNLGASWHLNRVEIMDTSARHKYVFTCDAWLSDKYGGCKKMIELDKPPTSQGPMTSLRDQWTSRVELLGWAELMNPQVRLRIDAISSQRRQVIERRLDSYAKIEWKPVSTQKLHAAHVMELTRDMVELMDACEKRVICNIPHSSLRAEVTIFTLLDIIQPAAIKVATYLQTECLKELYALHLPGLPENSPRGTLFQQSTEQLKPLCLRFNSLVHHAYAVRNRLQKLKDAAASEFLAPADGNTLLQCYDRVCRSVDNKAGSILAELRSAMRFSFARGLEVIFEECKDDYGTLVDDLNNVVRGSLDELQALWLGDAEPRNLLHSLFWSSLLQAVQGLLLGLSVWSLPSGFQLTSKQAEFVEAELKNLELHFDDTWHPAQSLLDVTQQPYMRRLLKTPDVSSRQLLSELMECSKDEVLRLSKAEARQQTPYLGTEVGVHIDDVMELRAVGQLQVLDFIRVLRARAHPREEEYRIKATEHVKSLHQQRHIQALFGLPFSQELFHSQALQLSHTHPETSRTNQRQILVIGQLYVFTSHIAFTTLLHSSPQALQLQQSTPGVTHQPLVSSDYTTLWHANNEVLHVEFVQSSMKLMMTLSDHSIVELWLIEKGQVYKLKDCYQEVRRAMGLPADLMEEANDSDQESCYVGFQSCFRA